MLTRLEVHGFKNLLHTTVSFGPFTCIFGANAVGKSNVFDVIQFLAALADRPFGEAARLIRGSERDGAGDPRDLFWDGYSGADHEMHLAAEMIVPPEVRDDLDESAKPAITFLRYEVGLTYEPSHSAVEVGRIRLIHESLDYITKTDARAHLPFPHRAASFRKAVLRGHRYGGEFLSTPAHREPRVILVHGDGGSRGKPQPRAADRSPRTVLSTVGTNDYPTILAARREMQSWRRLALEPSALRAPDGFQAPRRLGSDGSHLPAALYRIANGGGAAEPSDPDAVYARIADRLSDLIGVSVSGLVVEPDPKRETFTLYMDERGNLRLPARALSEGTLRFLALCVLLEDPEVTGLICMEEPENGIHPANLPAMVELIRDLAVDATAAPDVDNPFRQVVVNTHAAGVVQLCDPADLLLATTAASDWNGHAAARGLALASYRDTWRTKAGAPGFAELDALPYLRPPKGVQLHLDLSA